jgi:hypothetical protein
LVNAHANETFVVIDDDEPGAPDARLDIIEPQNGAQFAAGTVIQISALGVFAGGEVASPVEFYSGDRLIGRSSPMQSERPFIPYLPSVHTFLWTNPPPGPHVLTARTELSLDRWLQAPPVQISVAANPPQIAIALPFADAEFPLDAPIDIVTDVRDPDGYVSKVEFFAARRKIGESNTTFIGPRPGVAQRFYFVWRLSTPGEHVLTARATDNDGATTMSGPVPIKVATSEPLPIVRVTAPDPFAVELGPDSGMNIASFRVQRFGPTNGPLVVAYSLHGTAANGLDYERLSGLATILAGQRWANVTVRPLADTQAEGSETVLLRLEQLAPSPALPVPNAYRVSRQNIAAAVLSDAPWTHSAGDAQGFVLSENLLQVSFAAESDYYFRVEATVDFLAWETLFDTWSIDGAWHFIDTEMKDYPSRFYRLTPEPMLDEL